LDEQSAVGGPPHAAGGGSGEGKGGFDAAGEVLMQAAMGWGKK